MRFTDGYLLRLLLQTDLHCLVTAAAECTALWHVQKIDRRTADRDQTLLAVVYVWNRTQQSLRILMSCIIENIICRTALTDTSAIHYHDLRHTCLR